MSTKKERAERERAEQMAARGEEHSPEQKAEIEAGERQSLEAQARLIARWLTEGRVLWTKDDLWAPGDGLKKNPPPAPPRLKGQGRLGDFSEPSDPEPRVRDMPLSGIPAEGNEDTAPAALKKTEAESAEERFQKWRSGVINGRVTTIPTVEVIASREPANYTPLRWQRPY